MLLNDRRYMFPEAKLHLEKAISISKQKQHRVSATEPTKI